MRKTPVAESDEIELEAEKQWIYTYAFGGKSLSKQVKFAVNFFLNLNAFIGIHWFSCSSFF